MHVGTAPRVKGWIWGFVAAGVAVVVGVLLYQTPTVSAWFTQAPAVTAPIAPAVIRWGEPVQITAPPDRWSEGNSTPGGLFKIVPARGEKTEILFDNGQFYLLDSYEQVDLQNVSGHFRVRGVGKEVTVFVYRVR